MWHVLMWAVIGVLFAGWTAAAWGLHAAAQWFAGLAPAQLEAATAAAGEAARQAVPLPGWHEGLAAGLPAGVIEVWLAWMQSFLPLLQSLQQQIPALVDWLTPAIWIGWSLGAVVLLLAGIALHVVIAMFAGRHALPATPAQP